MKAARLSEHGGPAVKFIDVPIPEVGEDWSASGQRRSTNGTYAIVPASCRQIRFQAGRRGPCRSSSAATRPATSWRSVAMSNITH